MCYNDYILLIGGEISVKEQYFHSEICVLRMNASTHSQNMEANYV